MPPEQQQSEHSSYDFILKTEEPEQDPFISRINKKLVVIIFSVAAIMVVIALIVFSSLNAQANNAQKERLVEIAQIQAEIRRVSAIGAEKAQEPRVQSRASAILVSMEESLGTTEMLLAARDGTLSEELLSAKKNSGTDDQLNKAAEFESFDKAFEKTIDANLLNYQRALLAAEKAGNKEERSALKAAYQEANSILGLVDQP